MKNGKIESVNEILKSEKIDFVAKISGFGTRTKDGEIAHKFDAIEVAKDGNSTLVSLDKSVEEIVKEIKSAL